MRRSLRFSLGSLFGSGARAAAVATCLFSGMGQASASSGSKPADAAEAASASVKKAVEPEAAPRRHEITLYPAVVQLNVQDTLHVGVAASYGYRLQERIALKVMPVYNYVRTEGLYEKQPDNFRGHREPLRVSTMVGYGVVGGVELAALSGTAEVADSSATFDLMLDFGAGAGSTSVQLRPDSPDCATGVGECRPASYADEGLKLLTHVGAGVRVRLGERFMVRLEVRDLIFSSNRSKLNGCTFEDIDSLDRGLPAKSSSCRPEDFVYDEDRPLARRLLEETGGGLTHLVSVYGGVGFLF